MVSLVDTPRPVGLKRVIFLELVKYVDGHQHNVKVGTSTL